MMNVVVGGNVSDEGRNLSDKNSNSFEKKKMEMEIEFRKAQELAKKVAHVLKNVTWALDPLESFENSYIPRTREHLKTLTFSKTDFERLKFAQIQARSQIFFFRKNDFFFKNFAYVQKEKNCTFAHFVTKEVLTNYGEGRAQKASTMHNLKQIHKLFIVNIDKVLRIPYSYRKKLHSELRDPNFHQKSDSRSKSRLTQSSNHLTSSTID
ncbi:hypothetical protein LXL04_036861 [Taraxacum kok-saghyz]